LNPSLRSAFVFLSLLALICVPIWFFVGAQLGNDPRLVFRAMGFLALAAAISALGAGYFLGFESEKETQRLLSLIETEHVDRKESNADRATRLRTRMRSLLDESQHLNTLIDSMGEAVIAVNDLEKVVFANQVATQRFDIEIGSAVGGRLEDEIREVLWSGKEKTTELQKSDFDYSITISPTFSSEVEKKTTGAIVLLYDVSKIRKLEKIRKDFVANLSHELRTPIAVIQSSAETLSLPAMQLNELANDFAETIFRHSERMGTLIESLLRLSEIEATGDLLGREEISVNLICKEVLENVRPLAEEKSIRIESDFDDIVVMGERGGLSVVLQNLLENAIKYSPEKGRIFLTCKVDENLVKFTIRDEGIGIDEQHLDRIFERFYRVDEGRSRDIGGSGLGLALVKHLVRALDGTIEVESEAGIGSVFSVMFPKPKR